MDNVSRLILLSIILLLLVVLILSTLTNSDPVEPESKIQNERIFTLTSKVGEVNSVLLELREFSKMLVYNLKFHTSHVFLSDVETEENYVKIEMNDGRACDIIKDIPDDIIRKFKQGDMVLYVPETNERYMIFINDAYETYNE